MIGKQFVGVVALVSTIVLGVSAQEQDDPVLFTVEDNPVRVSEFEYIYAKTNGKKADFSRESLEEYLDLYVKFKLKVQRARDMQLDTIPQLQRELESYRRQLADSYLINREVTEKLVREAYERSLQDVNISHILVGMPQKALPEDTLAAYRKALEIKERLEKGASFANLAVENSDDRSAPKNKGNIGYINVPFPKGFYPLETAAYTLPLNTLSDPVRTSAGYHILKVLDRRPARGEIECAHILIRKQNRTSGEAKAMTEDIHQQLQNGADFEKLARQYSEDKSTAEKGGYIGYIGINRYENAFEDAAFGLKKDDAYTQPVETSLGWHIIKRIRRKDIPPYALAKAQLENKIKQDPRFEAARRTMIENIKTANNLEENRNVLDNFVGTLNDTFLTFQWKAPVIEKKQTLFELGGETTQLSDFIDYLAKATSRRVRLSRRFPPQEGAYALYEEFLDNRCLQYEESQLETKYPEFKSLMREYEEGILLFEATKMVVWDRAGEDSTGLAEFYKTIEGRYRWDERAVTQLYTLDENAADQVEAVRAYAADHTPAEVLAKFNSEADADILRVEEQLIERSKSANFNSIRFIEDFVSEAFKNPRGSGLQFRKVDRILQPQNKTLKEARGYIIADYQDYLEEKWVEELRAAYEVEINRDVFEELIKP